MKNSSNIVLHAEIAVLKYIV